MNPEKLLEHFRYIRRRIDVLLNAPLVRHGDVAALQSELRVFREKVAALDFISAEIRQHILAVDLRIAPVHLIGSREYFRKTWWMQLPLLQAIFLSPHEAKARMVLDAELSKLRDYLFDLYCLVEVTYKPA